MSNISQIVTFTLLYAMRESNNTYTNNNSNGFEAIFNNTMGTANNTSNTCNSCGDMSLDTLNTPISFINQNKVNSSQNIQQSNTSSDMDKAIDLLEAQLGKDYVWGATGPDEFDCSGLVQYIYKEALGKDIPRVSYDQSKFGQEVDRENLQVGDLVFFDTMDKGRVSHVGMYVGNNEFIHAANSRKGVIKSELSGYYEDKYICARRP